LERRGVAVEMMLWMMMMITTPTMMNRYIIIGQDATENTPYDFGWPHGGGISCIVSGFVSDSNPTIYPSNERAKEFFIMYNIIRTMFSEQYTLVVDYLIQ
jgi:hypothetical protein